MSKTDNRLWGGRFQEPTDEFVENFTASVNFDQRLAMVDIEGSLAHAKMLHSIQLLSDTELKSIVEGMQIIRTEIESGTFEWSVSLEDVHMNIEARLTALIGDAGKNCILAGHVTIKSRQIFVYISEMKLLNYLSN